jgi:hypothetical protein
MRERHPDRDGQSKAAEGGLVVEAELEGPVQEKLNRALFSARKTERRTRLPAEWTCDDGTNERFFDYVLCLT